MRRRGISKILTFVRLITSKNYRENNSEALVITNTDSRCPRMTEQIKIL